MGQLLKHHKRIPNAWACTVFLLDNLKVDLVGMNIEKCDMQFLTETFAPPYL